MDKRAELEESGRYWLRHALSEEALVKLERASAAPDRPGARLDWNDLFADALGASSKMASLADSLMINARPVRLVSFDKTPSSNWSVPWHQDRVIAVTKRHNILGYKNWTRKAGVWHTEPPVSLLDDMLFARIHFDDTDESNGCLQLALGTHKLGLVPADQAAQLAVQSPVETCSAKRGDVLFVKALTIHRSSSSASKLSRRALRIDYANASLAPPLQWALI